MALEQLFGGLCRAAMTLALPQGLPKVGRAVARAEELRGMLGPRFGNSAAPCNRSALLLLGVGRAIRAFGRCFVWLVIPKYRLEWANREGWTLLAACCNGNRAQRHGELLLVVLEPKMLRLPPDTTGALRCGAAQRLS